MKFMMNRSLEAVESSNFEEKCSRKSAKGITLVALVITIIVLLLLAGIAIATLGGEDGIFAKVKQAKKAQIESEMKEQLTMGLQELQVAKQGNATLDDVTQDWANEAILSDYNPVLQEDASYNGKLMIMTKDKITGKFMIDQNLNITSTEYNANNVEVEYTTISRTDNKVRINIVVTDNVNGIKQIDYPEGNPLKVVSGAEKKISIDYDVELGVEYKFVIISGDGSKTEKIIKIEDYFYNVTKTLGDGVTIDNNAIKVAYNKTYEAIVSTTGNYAITGLTVTMGGQTVTTSGNDVVDVNTGKIKIEKVTGDINIIVICKSKKIILYDNGDECEKITGGWQLVKDTASESDISSYNYILLNSPEKSYRGSAISTKNVIDLTLCSKLKFLIDKQNTGTYHYFRFGIRKTPILDVSYNAFSSTDLKKVITEEGDNLTVEIDLSNVSGDYYVGADLDTTLVKIYKIWVE